MKLAIAQLLAVVVAIGLFEIGQGYADLAFYKAGFVALVLSITLMLAWIALEFVELRRERALS